MTDEEKEKDEDEEKDREIRAVQRPLGSIRQAVLNIPISLQTTIFICCYML